MRSGEGNPSFGVPVAGTPLDYSEDPYRFHIETVDVDGTAERVLKNVQVTVARQA